MIDINAWPPSIAIAFGLAPFVIAMPGVAIHYYVACSRHFHIMLAALPNSAWPQQQLVKWGIIVQTSRLNMVGGISGFLLFPSYSIRKGLLDVNDVRNFPPYLRRWLVASVWLTFVGLTWLLLGVGLIKLSEG
ncbi:hypothetical protein ACIQUS_12600 [Pseudomonas sp. NPDC090755]|uniref:hypothetical protein n=1 Tax=Pseudomonas sp. NPDC090755 TaxID=3364481 RepID=UPI00383A4B0F